MPTGVQAMALLAAGSHLGGLLHVVSSLIPTFFLARHDMVHATPQARRAACDATDAGIDAGPLRWVWSSREFDRLCAGHMRHHFDPSAHHRFYGLVPYGRFAIRLVYSDWEDGWEDGICFAADGQKPSGVARRAAAWAPDAMKCKDA